MFYDQLVQGVKTVPIKDRLLILGDLDARVGADFPFWTPHIGKFGVGKINDSGRELLDLRVT
ncbi:hypothetical protein HOLleu_25562 [Holothuria leucospilota]|uniref:Uncharacterized protein n=1 Tax=Holothuria leucospilota TaxID=206669 RepID=A0A9Q1H3K4_HOLLE|nr:hypothetical protein HOLleu_25562 [Holothuria leucospilota]